MADSIFDVFNVDNPNEWGPEALHLFEELELANEGYERGDLFYRRHGGDTVAFPALLLAGAASGLWWNRAGSTSMTCTGSGTWTARASSSNKKKKAGTC